MPVMRQQTLWLTRHGNRLDFVDAGWYLTAKRPYDPPLSAEGRSQAKALAQRLAESYKVNGQTAWSLLEKAERYGSEER